ncbi:hypothetical protein GDO86_002686 [Hymenochirus boettgeri]|uniref:Uncharacterized protein n=1 Tax=Hymenochirus boettgeri TaxID=247094 RepID=A0A8T2K1C8_9PIPI|nr:hypothetical protein GDO86_002686 [Hymenochirus boettgeri]
MILFWLHYHSLYVWGVEQYQGNLFSKFAHLLCTSLGYNLKLPYFGNTWLLFLGVIQCNVHCPSSICAFFNGFISSSSYHKSVALMSQIPNTRKSISK